MATASTAVRDPHGRVSEIARAVNPLWAALAIAAAVVAIRATGTVDPDVSWLLWIAHQLNGGARLYRDMIEANPPLWFWMAIPVDGLAGLVHVRSDHVLIPLVGCLAALSLVATDRILEPIERPHRTWLLSVAALVLVAMPWAQFGQREQIALIGTLPYAALIGARRNGCSLPRGLASCVGAGAALGFALKPYFLLAPLSLELWLLAGRGREWRPIRVETIAVVAVGSLYAVALLLFARDYLSIELPLLLLAYRVTGAERVVDLFQPAVLTGLATLLLLLAHGRLVRSERSGFAGAMTIAAAAFAAAYFVQAKGWSYQAIPLAGCAALALAALVTAERRPRIVLLAAPALLCLPFWLAAKDAMREPPFADARQGLEGLRRGDSVGFLATDPAFAWSVTFQDGFRYPSRYYGFWMMRAVVNNERAARPDPRLTELGRRVVEQTVQDFRCDPPRRILVARPAPVAAKRSEFDILPFFLRDPHFAELLSHYRPVRRSKNVERFDQLSPLAPGSNCIRRVT
jgi:hypothetical protein